MSLIYARTIWIVFKNGLSKLSKRIVCRNEKTIVRNDLKMGWKFESFPIKNMEGNYK